MIKKSVVLFSHIANTGSRRVFADNIHKKAPTPLGVSALFKSETYRYDLNHTLI